MDLTPLTLSAAPFLHMVVGDTTEIHNELLTLEKHIPPMTVRFVRGMHSMTVAAMNDEVSAALQFPPHYGKNWDAFRDCMLDLSWLHTSSMLICVTEASYLLMGAPEETLPMLIEILGAATAAWNNPGRGKKARPYHVVFQVAETEEAKFNKRLATGKVTLSKMER
jgi:hypothetical protein